MVRRDSDDDSDIKWEPPMQKEWYKDKAVTTSSNSMSQTSVREGYGLTPLEMPGLIDDLVTYVIQS